MTLLNPLIDDFAHWMDYRIGARIGGYIGSPFATTTAKMDVSRGWAANKRWWVYDNTFL